MTKIEWTDKTWNPVTGCTKCSAGCKNCYAEIMARRLHVMGQKKYQNGFQPTEHPDRLYEPEYWNKPYRIFVCSMGDFFHPNISDFFRDSVIHTIERTQRHTYQFLTKRSTLMKQYFKRRDVPYNAWMGVTVENWGAGHRIKYLRNINARVRFLSCEPLLEDLGRLNLSGIHWVIVGGETGANVRPMNPDWARSIRDQCREHGIPFFFKQMPGKQTIPDDLMIREFPEPEKGESQ